MSNTVWISSAPSHPSNQRPMTHSFSQARRDYGIECGRRNDTGESLEGNCFPDAIWGASHAKAGYDKLPDLFFAGSYWAISRVAADVLRQFDLGGGALYPVKVFQKDQQTPIGDGWFCLNFGNQKRVFLPELSPKTWAASGGKRYFLPASLHDGDLAVSSVALQGPDIWIDPQVLQAFFVTDRLAKALKAAKATKGFFLSRCQVVES